jgi:hypothetical protein
MLSKLLGSSAVVIGLLLAGPQKASADVVYACVNTTTGLLYVVSATTNCPPPSSGYTWIKINWTATAGGQASNVLTTPLLHVFNGRVAFCSVVNLSALQRTVHVELIDNLGAHLIDHNLIVSPGGASSEGTNVAALGAAVFCKFTVTDGTSSDIRGALQACSISAAGACEVSDSIATQ